MNGIDDNFEPATSVRGVESEDRDLLKRTLNRVSNVCIGICVLALPVGALYPNGWAPGVAFTSFVLCLVAKQICREI